ncbi:UPF0769 protein C21orf59 homolog [Eurytemora carolleeae]|uniref:UPF0769 protein C21orf59 homolog n=1 Tax=Eurytemora carolleeae TaxID=1294199 RepID=UPI000C78C013|nr:UPF0769 protein C21orf59 homolog [Eurytemora carolleeae]|eukprot:XP_023333596.1 UPF0769 protein C21orf59 homolog [Eurytemora affinis]
MVLLHVKMRDESLFLYSSSVSARVSDILDDIVAIYNGRRKVLRTVAEVEELAKYGVTTKPEMQGLTPDQIRDLNLVDEYMEKCEPSGGFSYNQDPCQRRCGRAPIQGMKDVLQNAGLEAKNNVHRERVNKGEVLTNKIVSQSLGVLDGAVKIVFPMGLPPYDPIRMELGWIRIELGRIRIELENCEDLSGTQESTQVLDPLGSQLWFTSKEMKRDKILKDYFGGNEKSKVVVKLSKVGSGVPSREPRLSEQDRKQLMLLEHRRREELKKLIRDEDESHMNQDWADPKKLANSLQVRKHKRTVKP